VANESEKQHRGPQNYMAPTFEQHCTEKTGPQTTFNALTFARQQMQSKCNTQQRQHRNDASGSAGPFGARKLRGKHPEQAVFKRCTTACSDTQRDRNDKTYLKLIAAELWSTEQQHGCHDRPKETLSWGLPPSGTYDGTSDLHAQ
jgi:hypothetical protein